jgi:uncharacterized integral membrane protein
MRKLIWGLIIAALAMIFALQNAEKITIHLFFWEIGGTSLALILLSTFMLGILTGVLFMAPRLLKQQKSNISNKNQ